MDANTGFPFYKALQSKDVSFICEVKRASPSKGVIAEEFDYLDIAKQYEKAGANAISCLTEPYYFLGKDEYLKQIAENVTPLLADGQELFIGTTEELAGKKAKQEFAPFYIKLNF